MWPLPPASYDAQLVHTEDNVIYMFFSNALKIPKELCVTAVMLTLITKSYRAKINRER